jgi:hypothetical protein
VLSTLDDINNDITSKHKWIVTDHTTNFRFELALQIDNDVGETAIYLSSKRKVMVKAEGSP